MWKGAGDEVKIKFDITLLQITNLEDDSISAGSKVWLNWKRGSKPKNRGDTKKVAVGKDKTVTFPAGSSFTIESTLVQDPKTKQFKAGKKNLELYLKEVGR